MEDGGRPRGLRRSAGRFAVRAQGRAWPGGRRGRRGCPAAVGGARRAWVRRAGVRGPKLSVVTG